MTVDSQRLGTSAKPFTDPNVADDEITIATPPKGKKSKSHDPGMTSKMIKFRFSPPTNQKQQVAPSLIHTHWMHPVQETFGDDVEIINNRNQKVETINLLQWSNPLNHKKQFKTYQKTTGRDCCCRVIYYIIHRIQTNESLSTIRNIPQIQQILRDNNCYMSEHQWTETEWDTVSIGFVTNLDPGFYNNQQAEAKFHSSLKTQFDNTAALGRHKVKIPKFKMIFSSPSITTDQQRRVSTKAYAIEVRQEDQIQMIQILKTLLRNTPTFVPYHMRYKYPEGYAKALQYQTNQITSNRTIVLQYISDAAMYYLKDHIKAIDGVKDMLPAKDVAISGRHNILVDKQEFQTIRSQLMHAIAKWHDDFVEPDAKPPEGLFPGPPRLKPIADDEISSGENSWMSMSNASFISMDLSMVQNDDYFTTSQMANKTFSYAEVVVLPKAPTVNKGSDTHNYDEEHKEAFSDITGTRTSTTDSAYKRDMEHLQAAKDKELQETRAIIESQRREIQAMKETHQRELEAHKSMVAEVQKQHALAQEQVDDKLHHIQQQMRLEMARMVEQLMQTNLQNSPLIHIQTVDTQQPLAKRANENVDDLTLERNEKRQDNRKSPSKTKTNPYGETPATHTIDTKQSETSAMDEDDNASISE